MPVDKELIREIIDALKEMMYRERGFFRIDRCLYCYSDKKDPHYQDCKYNLLIQRLEQEYKLL